MKSNVKKISYKINSIVIIVVLGILFSAGITFAAAVWQGTGWITNGSVISAGKIKTNFDYLYEQINNGSASLWNKSGSKVYYNAGNVGIGTTAPGAKLDIEVLGTLQQPNALVIDYPSSYPINSALKITMPSYSGSSRNLIEASSGALGSNFVVRTNGDVGIGTTVPAAKLDLRGRLIINQSSNYDVWLQGGTVTSGTSRNLALLGVKGSDTLYLNYGNEYTGGVQMSGSQIHGLGTPTASTDAVTKAYVDANSNNIGSVRIVSNSTTAWRWPRISATCNSNEQITGGGGRCIASLTSTGDTRMYVNEPNGNGWYIECDTGAGQNVTATVYAICMQK